MGITKEQRQKYNDAHREQIRAGQRRWQKAHGHPCPTCGQLIHKDSQYCRKHRQLPRGEKACNWKGGRVQSTQGYILIYKPEHPRANKSHYVFEHILNWEQANGKPLPDGWHIHHLNGITGDNRPTNLVALPRKSHFLLFSAKAKRIQELEALLNHQNQLL